MMTTPHSSDNQEFSDLAHSVAQTAIYPRLFHCDASEIRFENVSLSTGARGQILDGQMGVDRVAYITSPWFSRGEICHTIQERFRKPKFMHRQDLTITEYNSNSGQKSELYKINAGIFVYGYFDCESSEMLSWVAIDTTRMMLLLANGTLGFEHDFNPRSKQWFVCIKFKRLQDCDCVLATHNFATNRYWDVFSAATK